jgi:hypothetical protein
MNHPNEAKDLLEHEVTLFRKLFFYLFSMKGEEGSFLSGE